MIHRLHVRVQPKASANCIDGAGRDDAGRPFLRVRVRALPADGEANAAVEATIAKALGLAKSAVKVVSGGKARLKGLEIDGPPELAGRIEGLMGDGCSPD